MTTFNGGSLGSCIDEERSELRYVMWIAEFSESSNLRTQMALQGSPCSMSVWVSVHSLSILFIFVFPREKKAWRIGARCEVLTVLWCADIPLNSKEKRSCDSTIHALYCVFLKSIRTVCIWTLSFSSSVSRLQRTELLKKKKILMSKPKEETGFNSRKRAKLGKTLVW